jgi:hypothetical protein
MRVFLLTRKAGNTNDLFSKLRGNGVCRHLQALLTEAPVLSQQGHNPRIGRVRISGSNFDYHATKENQMQATIFPGLGNSNGSASTFDPDIDRDSIKNPKHLAKLVEMESAQSCDMTPGKVVDTFTINNHTGYITHRTGHSQGEYFHFFVIYDVPEKEVKPIEKAINAILEKLYEHESDNDTTNELEYDTNVKLMLANI